MYGQQHIVAECRQGLLTWYTLGGKTILANHLTRARIQIKPCISREHRHNIYTSHKKVDHKSTPPTAHRPRVARTNN